MSNTITDAVTPQDPKEVGPKPPLPEQSQPMPGIEEHMTPKPDYGEESYKGSGRLQGRKAIITGGDSGIGRAVALAFAREGAVVTFTKGLAQEGAERGIRVNVVAPGPVWTPLIVSTMPPEKSSKFGQDSPMKRPAQPAELAPVYVLLASQEASYVNGMVYGVTGGSPLA